MFPTKALAMSSETFDPRRFQTTVPFYARYRLGYPAALIARVIEIVGLKPGDSVMDLGCGPGLLAIPFARAGMKVTAVDPEPEMLAAARKDLQEADAVLDIRQGSSFDLPAGIGPFRLVTMGRSFHWMDRAATLEILNGLISSQGAVALFHDTHTRTAENNWRRVLHELANHYGREESFHVKARESADYHSHESVLMNSAFSHLERTSIFIRRETTTDDIVGLAFSLSTTAPQKLGGRASEFELRLRAALAELSPDGSFTEIAEMTALIARRP